jgi:hypothetical protein
VVPRLGRAGLGNELFPLLRGAEISEATGRHLIAPRWFQLRVGPTLRGERDKRAYWRLFRRWEPAEAILRVCVETRIRLVPKLVGDDAANDPQYLVVSGMDGYFSAFTQSGNWHSNLLRQLARPKVLSAPRSGYLSVHIRLGDFARAGEVARLHTNNLSAPLHWYASQISLFRERHPDVPVVVSSDGTNQELLEVLSLPGVERSWAKNALDEMLIISCAVGLIGSRSTFSAWGAFLGDVPMVTILGGNEYLPHDGDGSGIACRGVVCSTCESSIPS